MLKHAVMSAARELLGDPRDITDVNHEYVRAVVEMTSELLGINLDNYDDTLREILASSN